MVLEVADSTIVNTALPAIRTALHASPAAMQWIVAAYLLGLGALLLIGGRLGDAYGHRRLFLGGIAGFVAASVLCGAAQTPWQLVAARLLQGLIAAMMAPQGMAFVQLLYTPLERVSKLAWFGVIVGLAAIIGPIAGGLLIKADLFGLGWRLIFLVNLPVGALALALGAVALPANDPGRAVRLDFAGAPVFAGGFGALLLGLIEGAELRWPLWTLATAAAGALLIAYGWRRAVGRRAAGLPALIEPALFRKPSFRWGTATAVASSASMAGFLLIFSVALQQGLGLTPLGTALIHMPFGAGVMAGIGMIGPRILPRVGGRLPIAGALTMGLAASLALRLIAGGDGGSAALVALLAAAGLGMGCLMGPLGPISVSAVERENAGTASATLRTAQQVGGALGVAIIGAAYFSASRGGAAALAALTPGGLAFAALISAALLSATRLPREIFRPQPAR